MKALGLKKRRCYRLSETSPGRAAGPPASCHAARRRRPRFSSSPSASLSLRIVRTYVRCVSDAASSAGTMLAKVRCASAEALADASSMRLSCAMQSARSCCASLAAWASAAA